MTEALEIIADVIAGYVDCGLWLSHCNGHAEHDSCRGDDCDTNLDDIGFMEGNLSADARDCVHADVLDFLASCLEERPEVFDGIAPTQIGQDLWLTRNGHGVGFRDRGLGERGDWLTGQAKPHGECYFLVSLDYHSIEYFNG